METFVIIAAVVVAVAISAFLLEGKAPKEYNERSCSGREWKCQFPNSPNEQIRSFLECFVDGMAFNSKERLKFKPSDEILMVYRSIYGGGTPLSDALECETFLLNVKMEFGVSSVFLEEVWHEQLTLGELFSHIIAQQGAQADPPPRHLFCAK